MALKDITAARNARRRELAGALGKRASIVDRLVAVHQPPAPPVDPATPPAAPAARKLKRYREE